MSSELARMEPANSEIDVASLLTAIVRHGVTSDAAGAVKELVLLREHQEDRDAKRRWLEAFARVRNATKTVNASKGIPDKNGSVKWYYAPLEDLQDAIEPILELHDMTMRFDSRREGNLCHGVCWVAHCAGHEEKSECAVNAANAQGGDLGAIKIAKRGAMTAMFGIKTRHLGDDASVLGDVVTEEQAAGLKARARGLGDELYGRFLDFIEKTCGSREFEKIRQGKFGAMDDALSRAERKKRGESPAPAQGQKVKVESRPEPKAKPVEIVNTVTGEVTEAPATVVKPALGDDAGHPAEIPPSDAERVASVDGFMSALNDVAMDAVKKEADVLKWLDYKLLLVGKKGKLSATTLDWRIRALVDARATKFE